MYPNIDLTRVFDLIRERKASKDAADKTAKKSLRFANMDSEGKSTLVSSTPTAKPPSVPSKPVTKPPSVLSKPVTKQNPPQELELEQVTVFP